jgi:hypothetical protein
MAEIHDKDDDATPNQTWPGIIALAFLVFVVAVLWLGLDHGTKFTTVWAGLGTVVGVLTGAIPSYFFKQQAEREHKRALVYAAALAPLDAERANQTLISRNLL